MTDFIYTINSVSCMNEFIMKSLLQKTFEQHQNNVMNHKAELEMPSASVKYCNNMMDKLVETSLTHASRRTQEYEEATPSNQSKILNVRIRKRACFRNSSINLGAPVQKRRSSRINLSQQHLDRQDINQKQGKTKQTQRIKSKNITRNRSNDFLPSFQNSPKKSQFSQSVTFSDKFQKIVPLSEECQATFRQQNLNTKQIKKHLSPRQVMIQKELQSHIDSLRNRKIKLQAAFSCFDNTTDDSHCFSNGIKENQSFLTNRSSFPHNFTKKPEPFKTIITDYDGSVISMTSQSSNLKPKLLKQPKIRSNVIPMVRIKTQIASNFLELQENKKSYKPSKKFIRHKTGESVFMSQEHSPKQTQKDILIVQRSRNNKPSIFDIGEYQNQNGWKKKREAGQNNSVQRYKQNKQNINSLFNIVELAKSKRMIERDFKSNKKMENYLP